jgi:hypothetical protein
MAQKVMIHVSNYKELLYDLLKRYEIPENSLEIVPSLQDCCKQHAIEQDSPFGTAKCFIRSSGGAYYRAFPSFKLLKNRGPVSLIIEAGGKI